MFITSLFLSIYQRFVSLKIKYFALIIDFIARFQISFLGGFQPHCCFDQKIQSTLLFYFLFRYLTLLYNVTIISPFMRGDCLLFNELSIQNLTEILIIIALSIVSYFLSLFSLDYFQVFFDYYPRHLPTFSFHYFMKSFFVFFHSL